MTTVNKARRVLLVCNDCIKQNMTGPAIRYWEFAQVLHRYFSVTLAVPPMVQAQSAPEELDPPFAVPLCQTPAQLEALTHQADVIITVGANLSIYPFLARTGKPLVVDMYIPFILEELQKYPHHPLKQQTGHHESLRGAHTLQIRAADFLICASQKQKDFWLGWLGALGRLNPYTHHHDPTLARLIAVVPFGLPRQPPRHQKAVLKGVHPAIAPGDKLILWGGGLWNWLDPDTLIKALARLAPDRPHLKLFFMGVKSPNPYSSQMDGPARAIQLSQEMGLYDRQVFFNQWTPYRERENYLLEADIGANLHRSHIETRFSFRTRFLDYIWAGLPILATGGDVLSQEVTRWQLGRVIPGGDVEQAAQALDQMLAIPDLRQHYKPHFDRVRPHYEWETVMAPLLEFCQAPYLAPDKPHLKHIPPAQPGTSSWWMLPGKILRTARYYGLRSLAQQARRYLQWKRQG